VKNVDWLKGGKLKAFSHHTPRIDENLANMKVTDDSWKPGKSVRQNKIVVCRQVQIDWLSRDKGTQGELITIISEASEEIYSSELIVSLIDKFWKSQLQTVMKYFFLPFCLNFAVVQVYMIFYITEMIQEPYSKTGLEIGIGFFFLTGQYVEIRQLCLKRGAYFELWNCLDQISLWLNLFIALRPQFPDYVSEHVIFLSASIAATVMWLKLFYWLRLFERSAVFIRLIAATLSDIDVFAIMLALNISMFGSAIFILHVENVKSGEAGFFEEPFENPLVDALVNQYLLGLGEFATDDIDGVNKILMWIFFLCATFITHVTFFNMLIAIMGDTFDRVMEMKEKQTVKERMNILADYSQIFQTKERVDKEEFLFSMKPVDSEEAGENDWAGKVAFIRKSIMLLKTQMNKHFESSSKNSNQAQN